MTLALFGGDPAIKDSLARFNTIGEEEINAVAQCMRGVPLSGFLGGQERGGPYVQRLEELWAVKFGVKHAIVCNSATSGLLAAAHAVDLGKGDRFIVSPFTMSATAAAPSFFGAQPLFSDVAKDDFCLDPFNMPTAWNNKAIVATNLFGHPAKLRHLRYIANQLHLKLIEDNAQAPFAMEGEKYAGTVGDIGVFSLNIHKHIQCGEGGVCVTDDDVLASRIRSFINHGEMSEGSIGLNLRLTEYAAAIAIEQFGKSDRIMFGRTNQAKLLSAVAKEFSWIEPPKTRHDCQHAYYVWAFTFKETELKIHRDTFIKAMEAEGFPLVAGYVNPLYHLPAFAPYATKCPVAEVLHNHELGYFENCGWTLTDDQISQFGAALAKIEANVNKLRTAA